MFLEKKKDLPGTPLCVHREAAKGVISGKIVSYSWHKKKKEQAIESELEQIIKTVHPSGRVCGEYYKKTETRTRQTQGKKDPVPAPEVTFEEFWT